MKKHVRQAKLAGILRMHDITYEELARGIGKSNSTISFIINGEVDFKVSTAKKIVAFVNKKAKQSYVLADVID